MYRTILLVLYLLVLIPSFTHLVLYRDFPGARRWSVGLGSAGILLAPYAARFLCELLVSVLSVGLYLLIFFCGIGLILKSIFR